MYTNIHAVALRTVKHNERSSILTAWSAETGRLSLLMPAGTGAESRRRRAITMPLGLFEGVVDVRPGRELLTIKDMRPWSPSGRPVDLTANPVVSSVAMFVAEAIEIVTREGSADPALWVLVTDTVMALSSAKPRMLANLPAAFLIRLAAVSGIEPDTGEYRAGTGLDLLEGVFRHTRPLHDYWADAADMRPVMTLARAAHNYSHIGLLHLDRQTRTRIVDGLISYFALHHYPLDRMRSLDILRAFYSA